MKSILRNTLINALTLFFLTQIFNGVKVEGGLTTFLLGGLTLTIVYKILKPIINIVSLPINILTLGFASLLINVILFYIATSIIPEIKINAFVLQGFSFAGFVVPTISLNTFSAYFLAAAGQSTIVSFISWIRD